MRKYRVVRIIAMLVVAAGCFPWFGCSSDKPVRKKAVQAATVGAATTAGGIVMKNRAKSKAKDKVVPDRLQQDTDLRDNKTLRR